MIRTNAGLKTPWLWSVTIFFLSEDILTLSTLGKFFSRRHIVGFTFFSSFFFFQENRIWHFMQILSNWDNLHEMSNLVSWEKFHLIVSWMRVRLETRRSRVRPPPRSATFFRGDWSWNIFYGHSLPSADSRRAVVSFWRKNVHNTG